LELVGLVVGGDELIADDFQVGLEFDVVVFKLRVLLVG
jgi:hypothetical protein